MTTHFSYLKRNCLEHTYTHTHKHIPTYTHTITHSKTTPSIFIILLHFLFSSIHVRAGQRTGHIIQHIHYAVVNNNAHIERKFIQNFYFKFLTNTHHLPISHTMWCPIKFTYYLAKQEKIYVYKNVCPSVYTSLIPSIYIYEWWSYLKHSTKTYNNNNKNVEENVYLQEKRKIKKYI